MSLSISLRWGSRQGKGTDQQTCHSKDKMKEEFFYGHSVTVEETKEAGQDNNEGTDPGKRAGTSFTTKMRTGSWEDCKLRPGLSSAEISISQPVKKRSANVTVMCGKLI